MNSLPPKKGNKPYSVSKVVGMGFGGACEIVTTTFKKIVKPFHCFFND